jgi:stage III sporulation protein AD
VYLAFKAVGAALLACICAQLIRRRAPEHALLLTLAAALWLIVLALPAAGELWRLWQSLSAGAALSGAVVAPVAKCVGLGLLTRLGADLCRDSGSGAAATAVELVGCVCALLAASPLMVLLFEMIGGYV